MSYRFGKLWHLAIIWAIRKSFQCILQGVRILLANHTRLSPTSENDSYYFSFLPWDGWLPIYTKKFVFSAPPVFSFAAFAIISSTSTWKSKKWCLTTCHVDITWKLYSLDFINLLCPCMRHPWLLFRTCIKLNPHFVCRCLTLQNFYKIHHFFWRLGPESCYSTICLANV